MRKQFKTFLIATNVALLIVFPLQPGRGCGPELATDQDMFLLFQRGLATPPDLGAFYYTESALYNGYEQGDDDERRNCGEWAAFSKGAANLKDIYNIEYNLSSDAFMAAYNSDNWNSLADNTFIKWLRGNKQAMDYFVFAKKLEFVQTGNLSPWDEIAADQRIYDSLLITCKERYTSSLPDFLKERYAFQAVKMMYYRNYPVPMAELYEHMLKGKNTMVADWGMYFYAFSFSDKGKRAQYLLNAFDKCESKRLVIYQCLSKEDVNNLLGTAIDNKTKTIAYAYDAIKNPGKTMDDIQKVFETEPGSKYLPLLIGREVNKVEDWILSPEVLGFNSTLRSGLFNSEAGHGDTTYEYYAVRNLSKDREYANSLRDYLVGLLPAAGANSNFIRLAIVRLCHINNDFTTAAQYLAAIPRLDDLKMEAQRLVEQTVTIIYTKDITATSVQDELEHQFTLLEKNGLTAETNPFEYEDDGYSPSKRILNELYLLLSKQFQQKGDVVTAGLLFKKAGILVNDSYGPIYAGGYYTNIDYFDKFGAPADIDRLIAFLDKDSKSAFQKRITPAISTDKNIYLDLKGTLLLRRGDFSKALEAINDIPNDFWQTTYEFHNYIRKSNISSVGSLLPVKNGRGDKYATVNKKDILRDIIALQKELQAAKTAPAKAQLSFLLGNCYYNLTYWGKDWMMYSYGNSANEISAYNYGWKWIGYTLFNNDRATMNVYYQCAWATNMYRNALANAGHDKELAAQCLLMLSLCDRNAHTYREEQGRYANGVYHYSDDKLDYISAYLRQLNRSYGSTIAFTRAITECPDIGEHYSDL